MFRKWTVVVSFFIALLCNGAAMGQYFLFRNNDKVAIDISFAISNQELNKELFFNVLKVKNTDASASTFVVDFTAPSGWQIIGEISREITLAAYDSILIPIRIAVPKEAKGEVAYSIIATIKDRSGNVVKNEYCYVKIPKSKDLSVRFLDRYIFISSNETKSEFRLQCKNNGNQAEQLYFNMESGRGLVFARSYAQNLSSDINLPPFTDTIISFPVIMNVSDKQLSQGFFAVNVKASTQDTSFRSTVWFKQLASVSRNIIDASDKALVVDLSAQGLFNDQVPTNYSLYMAGGLALTEEDRLYYSYRNRSSSSRDDFLKYSFSYLGYVNNYFDVKAGDFITNYEIDVIGRGVDFQTHLRSLSFRSSFAKNQYTNDTHAGADVSYAIYDAVSLNVGAGHTKQGISAAEQFVGYGGVALRIGRYQKIQGRASISDVDYAAINQGHKQAMGLTLGYALTLPKYSFSVMGRSYPSDYVGYNRGRSTASLNMDYSVNKDNSLRLTGNYEYYNPRLIGVSDFLPSRFYRTSRVHLNFMHKATASFSVYNELGYDEASSDNFSSLEPNSYFGVKTYSDKVGMRINFRELLFSMSPSFTIGYGDVYSYSNLYFGTPLSQFAPKRSIYQVLSLLLVGNGWGSMFSYYNGPRNLFENYINFYASKNTRYLRVTPYLDKFIYKDILKLRLQLAYSNNIVAGSTSTTVTGYLTYFLPRDWWLYFQSVYAMQSKKENGSEAQSKYSTVYFEAGVHKEFNWQQPNRKFYNLEMEFFKDLNGNKRKDENEPGIRDVLVQLEYVGDTLKKNNSLSYNGETLSDQYGNVKFINIPRGTYRLQYDAVGKDLGAFSKDQDTPFIALVANTTLELPFVEKNKVFGKIVLNRSKLSALGKVDMSNVRISAKDSQGRIYSTLTNADGYFILYAPVTDNYNVTVSNVYTENFDLRQGSYLVHFNGYKQFEVNFVFDEKIRTINFTKSGLESNLAGGVLEIRRTNLRGVVKDVVSLKPVTAKINIINKKNNQIIASITSNRSTGEYGVSFAAANDYAVEVVADGYWYYSASLDIQQVTTFEDVSKDYTLTAITIGASLELKNLTFDSKSSELTPEGVAEITRLVGMLKENPTVKIQIQGHCDDLEALDNPAIGDARARNVARYLVERGFSKFETKNMGNTVPVAPNDTEENRRINRRVDIVVTNK
ncbi:OmpA family protein [Williamwhitmania taraxaci]|uniref:Outer membrane protein OmpA n=1 Tax=Williamwhitmania taraxaci TaxID=1640674 RepID=A0A1G6K7W8_9BACT|nr:OmpA family protein [Williamwhitmania taraxaci]SDC26416.1 Outer membrane protein OmpA [Williamwhitmania taraxaci]